MPRRALVRPLPGARRGAACAARLRAARAPPTAARVCAGGAGRAGRCRAGGGAARRRRRQAATDLLLAGRSARSAALYVRCMPRTLAPRAGCLCARACRLGTPRVPVSSLVCTSYRAPIILHALHQAVTTAAPGAGACPASVPLTRERPPRPCLTKVHTRLSWARPKPPAHPWNC